jgi:hypothetical protein
MSFPEQVFALDESAVGIGYDHAKDVMRLICNTELEKLDADPDRVPDDSADDNRAIDMLSKMVYSMRSPKKFCHSVCDGNCEECAQVAYAGVDLATDHDFSGKTVYYNKELTADEVNAIFCEGPVDVVKSMAKTIMDESQDKVCVDEPPEFDWEEALKSWDEPDQAELDKVLESQLKMPC